MRETFPIVPLASGKANGVGTMLNKQVAYLRTEKAREEMDLIEKQMTRLAQLIVRYQQSEITTDETELYRARIRMNVAVDSIADAIGIIR